MTTTSRAMGYPPGLISRDDNLPRHALEKLTALEGAAEDAREAAASAQRRHTDLRRAFNYSDGQRGDAENIQQEMTRLASRRDRQNQRQQEIAALVSRIREWLRALPSGSTLEPAEAVTAKLRKGETLTDALTRVRDEIAVTQRDLRAVQAAPLPKADLKHKVREHVDTMAQRGRPKVSTNRGALGVSFASESYSTPSTDRFVSVMAWLFPDAMTTRLQAEIDALPEPALALSAREKAERSAELISNLLHLERQEEALIERTLGDGLDVLRRSNADPAAVLGVIVTTIKRRKAVAA